jgi:hypothetical protein
MAFRNSSPTVPSAFPLLLDQPLTPSQLARINIHLDQLLLALYALTGLDQAIWQQTLRQVETRDPGVTVKTVNRLEIPQALPSQSVSQLDLDGIRALVAVISHLTQQYQELLRRAITLAEQRTEQGKDPFQTMLLGGYATKLKHLNQSYCANQSQSIAPLTDDSVLSLLMELLFYSSQDGARRLWGVLLVTAQTLVYEASPG